MALDNYQQAYNLFGKGKNILIIAGHNELEDTYPAALGLARALKKNKKEITLFSRNDIPEYFYFLKDKDDLALEKTISGTRDIIVSIDVSGKLIKQINYKRNNSRLDIRIVPKHGARIQEEDVHIKLGKFQYDLVVTVGLPDLTSLGEEFERNASFFFETPIINIDKNSSNERYGEINIIELTSSSCSEIMSGLLKEWDEELLGKEIATSLLAGIIVSTNNFQNSRTTPSALFASAHLMSRKGDQQKIIKNIFKTKSFEFLKLWGIAMSKLEFMEDKKISWLSLSQDDFKESGATPKAIPLILSEFKNNFSQAHTFVIFWENHTAYFGLINTLYREQMDKILEVIKGKKQGNSLLFVTASKKYEEREKILQDISRAQEAYEVE